MYRFGGTSAFISLGHTVRSETAGCSDNCMLFLLGVRVGGEEDRVGSLMFWCRREFPGPSQQGQHRSHGINKAFWG